MNNPHTVVIIFQAKSGKELELKQILMDIVQLSRTEKSCLSYRLHQDKENRLQFILYENWESREAHQIQFERSYIKEFSHKAKELLADSYQVYYAEEILC